MKGKPYTVTAIHYLATFILLFLTLIPFYFTLINSFKYRMEIVQQFWGLPVVLHWDNYTRSIQYLFPYILNSLWITGCIVIGVLILSSMAAFSFAKYDFPLKSLLYTLVIMLFMIPGFLLLVPQFILIKNMGLLNTYSGQIFPPLAVGTTVATMLMREFFQGIPNSLYESAEVEGAGSWTLYTKIAIPLSLPILSVVSIMNAMSGWNNYIWPLVMASDDKVKPVILALGRIPGSIQQGLGLQLAGYVVASIPLIIVFIFTTRTFVTGLTVGAVKG